MNEKMLEKEKKVKRMNEKIRKMRINKKEKKRKTNKKKEKKKVSTDFFSRRKIKRECKTIWMDGWFLRPMKLLVWRHHHHHVVPLTRISLTLSRHFSLSFIASGRSLGLHPVSSLSCCMYVRAGRPAFAWPYAGVHRSTSLMSSSLLCGVVTKPSTTGSMRNKTNFQKE